MPTATMTSKGQITLPIEIRRSLKLDAGDKIDFVQNHEGHFVLRPKTGSIMEMKGIFRRLGIAPLGYVPTDEQMNQAMMDHAAALDAATKSGAVHEDLDGNVA